MKQPRARTHRGLTLIELAIGLALTAMLVSMAMPSFAGFVARQRVRAAAEHLALDLAEAREEAARRGSPVHLVTRPGAGWCYALAGQPEADCQDATVLKQVRAADHPGVTLLAADALRLDGSGASGLATNGQVLFSSSRGDRVLVRLSPLGRATLCTPGGTLSGLAPC